jgi:hypothetical protein
MDEYEENGGGVMMDFRLERSQEPPRPYRIDGILYKPKRQWRIVAVFPYPVNPSCLSATEYQDRNSLIGISGAQCRVTCKGKLISLYQWDEIPENPGDPDSTRTIWGWRLIESGPMPPPERTHFSTYIPSVT